jgi:hypothetical protein
MKKILLVCSIVMLTACSGTKYQGNGGENPDPPAESTLELAFVAGHFGSYWDCPEDAFGGDEGAPEPVADSDSSCAGPGPCGPLNCEPGQVTLQIQNVGEEAIQGLHIAELQALGSDDEVIAVLPVLSVDATDMEDFDGSIGAGETATLRIDFQGPRTLRELVEEGIYATPVRVIIEVDDQDDAELTTPPIESSPIVDT